MRSLVDVRVAGVFTCVVLAQSSAFAQPALHTCSLPVKASPSDPAFATTQTLATGAGPAAIALPDGTVVTLATNDGNLVGARSDAPTPSTFGDPSGRREPTLTALPAKAGQVPQLIAAWISGAAIEVSTSSDGGRAWRSGERSDVRSDCDVSSGCPRDPMIIAGTPGSTVYLGYTGDAIGTRVRASRDGGATFGSPVTALVGTEAAAIDDGRLHVIAIKGGPYGAWGSAEHAVEYTVSADGGRSFTKATRVSNRDDMLPLRFARPAIATDPRRGWIYVAYVRGGHDGIWDIVIAASKDKGVTWFRNTLSDHCSTRILPSLAVDAATGTLHVAWLDNQAGGRFAHGSCLVGATQCADWGAIGGAFELALDGSTGSRTALVIDAKRVIHAVWTRAPAIVHASAKLR